MAHLGLVNGTFVMTLEGEVAVEKLRVGTRALTLASTERPIQPLAAIAVGPVPPAATPILVRAGAIADFMPVRDLVLAPDQPIVMREDADDAVKLDFSMRRLIPVRDLANGATVTRIAAGRGARYHRPVVAAPDLLMADGLCVATAAAAASSVLPLLEWAAAQPYRERLLARARATGWVETDDPALAVEVEGVRLVPMRLVPESGSGSDAGSALAVTLPPGVGRVVIASRVSVPEEFEPGCGDTRRLGVALAELVLDGEAIPLDAPLFGGGLLPPERDGVNEWRWTNGAAVLNLPPAARARVLTLRIHPGWRRYRAKAS